MSIRAIVFIFVDICQVDAGDVCTFSFIVADARVPIVLVLVFYSCSFPFFSLYFTARMIQTRTQHVCIAQPVCPLFQSFPLCYRRCIEFAEALRSLGVRSWYGCVVRVWWKGATPSCRCYFLGARMRYCLIFVCTKCLHGIYHVPSRILFPSLVLFVLVCFTPIMEFRVRFRLSCEDSYSPVYWVWWSSRRLGLQTANDIRHRCKLSQIGTMLWLSWAGKHRPFHLPGDQS